MYHEILEILVQNFIFSIENKWSILSSIIKHARRLKINSLWLHASSAPTAAPQIRVCFVHAHDGPLCSLMVEQRKQVLYALSLVFVRVHVLLHRRVLDAVAKPVELTRNGLARHRDTDLALERDFHLVQRREAVRSVEGLDVANLLLVQQAQSPIARRGSLQCLVAAGFHPSRCARNVVCVCYCAPFVLLSRSSNNTLLWCAYLLGHILQNELRLSARAHVALLVSLRVWHSRTVQARCACKLTHMPRFLGEVVVCVIANCASNSRPSICSSTRHANENSFSNTTKYRTFRSVTWFIVLCTLMEMNTLWKHKHCGKYYTIIEVLHECKYFILQVIVLMTSV